MKVYVASSWRNPQQPYVVQAIRVLGHEVYDFRNPHATSERDNGAKGKGFHWTEIDPKWRDWTPAQLREALNTPRAVEGFHSDYDALNWCDACVMVPGETAGRSMHLELGYAAGLGKRTIILLSSGEPELMYKMASHIAVNLDELAELLGRNGYDSSMDIPARSLCRCGDQWCKACMGTLNEPEAGSGDNNVTAEGSFPT